jgi:TOTE conflict system primase-like protein
MQELPHEALAAYASVFVQRWDQYAVQQRDGSYWRVAELLSLTHLAAHLAGQWTLGTYVLDASSHCSFAVFDADREDGLDCLADLAEELLGQGVPTVLEASRRGGHLWVHLVEQTPAQMVRVWLLPYAMALGLELYPKQNWLTPDGSGSLIRLPLGVHRQSRGWYPFVQRSRWGDLVPVGETMVECCTWACRHVQRVAVPASVVVANSDRVPVLSEPKMGVECERSVQTASHWSYASIRQWCQTQDSVAMIGRYVALDCRGVGSCPFKEHHYRGDLRPSFQVFGGSNPHWYCYTWRRAGDLFDFLCLYYHLTPQKAWQRLQQGGLW